MTTIQIELPEATAQAAKAAGLLTSQAIERLLSEAIRNRALERLDTAREKLTADSLPPMTGDEIQAEIEAYRAEKRAAARP